MVMPRARTTIPAIAAAATLLVSAVAWAGAAEDAAAQFLRSQAAVPGERVSVTVDPAAAALPACVDPQPFLPGHGQRVLGRVTVGIRCGDGQMRYLQARVAVEGDYWVAGQTIPAGTPIAAGMFETRHGDLAELPRAAVLDLNAVIGDVATRSLARGTLLQRTQLQAPRLVRRASPVTVEATGAGFKVSRQGESLQDGAIGDTVRVRMANRSVLSGVVAGNGIVKVSF